MSQIIQDLKITKIINPHKSDLNEYSLMITYRDTVYTTKITENNFKSVLFEFDMLENLIYNSNHNQKVGDIDCSMELIQKDNLERILEIYMKFVRDVKPMKKIEENHQFVLSEKKLDYDDKIGLAMMNLRSEINFIEIKPTTEIEFYECNVVGNVSIINQKLELLKDKYINSIKLTSKSSGFGGLTIFIDKTKKPNGRKFKFYEQINYFNQVREQFKTYHILDITWNNYVLVEEMP